MKSRGKSTRIAEQAARSGYRSRCNGCAHPATGADALRALALQRAEAIKAVLVTAGIQQDRIYIDEPGAVPTLGKKGGVLTTLDLKAP